MPIFLVLVGAIIAFSCDDSEVLGSLTGTAGGVFFVGDCGLLGRPGLIGGPGLIGCGSLVTGLPSVESEPNGLLLELGPESVGVLVLSGPVGDKQLELSSFGGGKDNGDGFVGEYPLGFGSVGGGCLGNAGAGFFLTIRILISSPFIDSLNVCLAL